MFERYLTDALTMHFGHLVENVDAEKVRLSAWSGKLVLEDLCLRTDALDHFVDKSPVEIAYGRVGKLDVQVPWSLVGAQLWKRKTTNAASKAKDENDSSDERSGMSLVLSDVNILITPRRNYDSKNFDSIEELSEESQKDNNEEREDIEATTQKGRERKEKAVQDLIYSQLLTRVAISASQSSSRWKWLQDCLSGLLSNLKITIRNIHIRYEDPGSCMGFVWNVETSSRPRRYRRAFSIGIKLGEFSVKTKSEREMDAAKDSCAATGKSIKDSSIDDSATDYSSGDEGQEEKAGALPSVPSMNSDKELPDSYQTRRKVAAAEKLAIYWDSGGCCLISQMAPAKGDTMNGKGALERKYVDAAFSALNDGETEAFFPDESHYKRPHSYLLDPVSPSVHFKLLSQLDLQQGPGAKDNNDQANVDTTTTLPPSSIKIVLPQTEFSISRRTLEDAVYLRKSLSVWTHAKKGLLSEKTLKRLAKLRPVVSAVEDPRGWWKYTAEATIAFIKVSQQGQEPRNRAERRCSEGQPLPESRRSGWLGLAQALSQRKRYVALYKQLFSDQDKNSDSVDSDFLLEEKRARAHESLLELEDDLTAAEICAFRIFSYNALAEDKSVKIVQRVLSHEEAELDDRTSTSKWRSFWNKADVNTGERLPVEATNRLSLEHRIQSFLEMAHALLREKINSEVHEKEQKKHEMDHILERDSHLIDVSMNRNSATWDMSVSCQELSLQVNDQRVRTTTRHASRRSSTATSRLPVVRLSCACLAESVLYVDGSWEVECTIASLVMKDLTRVESSSNTGLHNFSNLVGPKRINDDSASEDMLTLGGSSFPRSVHVKVTRQLTFLSQDKELESGFPEEGSITKTQVRLYPLEVVYATVPVESLSRVLATVKTPELSDDYHRMAGRVYEWRDKQKKRLLKALAHKEKKIIVDVDITAPVLLIPETFSHMDSPMVVIDLGHVRFSNAAVDNGNSSEPITWDIAGFDDAWILALTNMQVQSTTALLFREFQGAKSFAGGDSVGLNKTRQIVEPFSLDFSILTAVAAEGDKSQMRINATLPRLSFNLMSSAVRLMCRLRSQWAQQKDEVNANEQISTLGIPTFRDDSVLEEANSAQQHPPPRTAEEQKHIGGTDRLFEFYFSAPLVTLQLENDVDERSSSFVGRGFCNEHDLSIPLIDLALRGMSGNLVQKVDSSGNISSAFEARLHSMDAIDLYQTAGPDYSLLLSSLQSQNSLDENVEDEGVSLAQYIAHRRALMLTPETDLVEVEYSSCARAFEPCDDNQSLSGQGDKASIKFHELYVEWNPETIAAVQEAMRTPTGTPIYEEKELSGLAPSDDDDDLHSDEEFFDAEEFEGDDVFFDTFLGTEKEVSALITPSHGLTFGSASPGTALEELPLRNNGQLKEASFCGLTNSITKSNATMPLARTYMKVGSESSSRRPFQMEFNLSKLRVNFNKESRHRRLMVAEMDRTYIKYETTCSGGSKTFAQLGNLIFLDPAASNSETLYGQILGLQADALTGSLLEMEVTVNPKRRQTIGLVEGRAKDLKADVDSVSICYDNGSVFGCDTMVRARFSPMRFVYLQQLWSEIVDYFFEGVMGYEVWGKQRPTATSTREISQSSLPPKSVNPFQVSFTRFEIKIESPVVLFPVQYRSTQFIRLNATTINVSNFFSCSGGSGLGDSVKWQNNCDLSFIALRLFSWDGREINHSTKGVGASVAARWPIGPLAPLIMPKYYITCNLGNLALSMRREDYALFQNLMAYNFGELSRNIDEWEALQNLTQEELAEYKNSVKVHFGYDKKDVAPTTYKVELSCPLFSISLMSKNESAVALMSCSNLVCEMKKDSDGISRQKVSCNVDLSCPKNDKEHDVLLSSAQVDNIRDLNKRLPQLKYTSISKPSGDNIKTLDIKNGCIYMVYPAWKKLSEFFTALPEAELLTAEEISLSVQIGDRWYRIGPSRHSQSTATPMATDKTARRFSWIGKNRRSFISTPIESTDRKAPSFQFRVTLTSPSIILPSSKTNYDASIVLRLQHLDFLHVNDGETITRSFFLHDLELYTSSSKDINRDHYSDENSLIKPWCVVGTSRRCTDKDFCTCKSHSLRVSADKLKARAAFSDMIIAIDVCLRLASDIRQCKEQDDSLAIAPNRSSESKENKNMSSSQEQNILKSNPTTELTALEWEGFELQVVDDSGRHFATSQELITLALGNISFSRKEDRGDREADMKSDQLNAGRSCEIALRLASIDVFDCLQVKSSPFRLLATSRPERNNKQWAMPTTPRSKITWDEYAMTPSDEWGFSSSVALAKRIPGLEFASNMSTQTFQKDSDSIFLRSYADELSINYDLKLNSFSLQWSPASVIATQRFLGRLKKQAVKSLHAFNEEIASLLASSETVEQTTVPKSNGKVKIVINFQAFTVCLNKEHQYRRLLQVSFLGTVVSFESDKDGSVVSGSVFDVTAWDCDDHEKISDELDRISPNKCVLMVTRPKESNGGNVKRSFLVFSYRTFNKPAPDVDGCKVPSWVLSHVSSGEDGGIDDYLEVSIATIELTYLKEKNEEIFDYLSNGLPGKGMGRFNKSAQGFLKKRIRTKSFLQVQIEAPTLYIPADELSSSGVTLRLGELRRIWDKTKTYSNFTCRLLV